MQKLVLAVALVVAFAAPAMAQNFANPYATTNLTPPFRASSTRAGAPDCFCGSLPTCSTDLGTEYSEQRIHSQKVLGTGDAPR